MFFKNLINSGWLHALFIAVIAYPLGAVSQKFVVSYTDSNILVYTALFMLSSAIALLFVAGPGELANKTLKRPETWIYSFLQILTLIFGLLIMRYVSATEGVALGLMTGIFTLLISTVFLNQKTNRYELLGVSVILYGFYMIIMAAQIPTEAKAFLILFILARGFSQSSQKLITEIHKTNRKAVSFKSQIRVTGFIMAVASFVFLTFLLSVAFIKSGHDISFLKPFPYFNDFMDSQVYIFAGCLGLFVVSVSKYCEFFAGKSIGAKYLTSITSLQIIFVYLLELVLARFDLLERTEIDYSVIGALALILFGNFVISMAGFIKDFHFIKKGEKQDTLANLDDNFMEEERDFKLLKLNLSNLLTLYNKDSKKLAQELEVDRITLDNIMSYDFDEQKIENKLAKKINDFASQQVGNIDKLTKAYNRYYLDHKADELLKTNNPFKLYFLDLNKFKPINDEYGHDAGDLVLATTIPRLSELEAFNDCVFRVGGDEFVLLQVNNIEEHLEDLITKTIELPVKYNDIQLQISTSIGRVHSNDYDNLESMLKDADELMFEHKKSKGVNR